MTKMFLLGLAGGTNKGNLALLYSIMETIRRFDSDVEFVLSTTTEMSRYTPGLKEDKRIGILTIRKPKLLMISLFYLFECILINIFNRFCRHISIPENSRLFEYSNSEIVICGGGDSMSGENGIGILTPLLNILYAILLRKPIILYGESLGYYSNFIVNFLAKFVFNKIKLILAREELSKKYLDDNSVTNPKVYVTADPAFVLNPVPRSRVFEILHTKLQLLLSLPIAKILQQEGVCPIFPLLKNSPNPSFLPHHHPNNQTV